MHLERIDWVIIIAYFAVTMGIGVAVARRAGRDSSQFFLSGRGMPWWLLGFSMVATTFSTDTPNLVTDIVRTSGVAGNWVWWAFLLTGMLTVFVYARLWRRSGVLTDIEFYEVRYAGRSAAFLRGFRALYLGVFLNVVIMASVSLAAIKIGGVLLGLSPVQSILAASLATVVFSALGGLRSVILTDFLLFILAMVGAFVAAAVALDQPGVGGLRGLVENPALQDKLRLIPDLRGDDDAVREMLVAAFIIPLAVQWWSAWYPGAEPGGGGYMAQRMLAARSEGAAQGAALFFNIAHYALRPWPWIIVALASLVVFPELDDLRTRFPQIPEDKVGHDLAYSAMLTFIPSGWLGVVLASLAAAYMSTISTHLNWGASYVVNDFYKRFVRQEAGERELVAAGRIATVLMMVLAGVLALSLRNAKAAFDLIIGLGAGTGLVYILRWLWWRVSAVSEIVAMFTCMVVVLYFALVDPESGMKGWQVFLTNVGLTTVAWVGATLLTRPTDDATLRAFCRLVRPPGPGWRRVYRQAEEAGDPLPAAAPGESLPRGIVRMVLGCLMVYGVLLGTGCWIYGRTGAATALTATAVASAATLVFEWRRSRAAVKAGTQVAIAVVAWSGLAPDAFAVEPKGEGADEGDAARNRRPNIVLIVSDDQGWNDVGYHDPELRTPHMDALARTGVRLDRHYVQPQCTPTRVALLTGRYPSRFGPHCTSASNERALPEGTPTLASVLGAAGYDTALMGKWHLGSKPDWGPNHYGFDHSYGSLAGAVGMYDHRYRLGTPFTDTWHRDHALLKENEEGHVTDLVMAAAVRWLAAPERTGKPFFLYLPFHAVHTPLVENDPRWEQMNAHIADPDRRLFASALSHLDWAVGEVVRALDEHGHRERTVIVFTSDNGGIHNAYGGGNYPPPDPALKAGFSSNTPLRGGKTTAWEGGIRVPAFVNWPAVLEPRAVDAPLHAVDWLPTIVSLTGVELDEGESALDGINAWPVISGESETLERERPLYWVWGPRRQWEALQFEGWKIVRNGPDRSWQLFDLGQDPEEKTDLADERPDLVEALAERFTREQERDRL